MKLLLILDKFLLNSPPDSRRSVQEQRCGFASATDRRADRSIRSSRSMRSASTSPTLASTSTRSIGSASHRSKSDSSQQTRGTRLGRCAAAFASRDAVEIDDCSQLARGNYAVIRRTAGSLDQVSADEITKCDQSVDLEEVFENQQYSVYRVRRRRE